MLQTWGGGSSTHVEHSYLDDDKSRQHDYDQKERDYDYGEHQSQYMHTGPTDTSVLWL